MPSFLPNICKAIRDILSADDFMIEKLTDSKKPDDNIIGNKPLTWKQLIRDYNFSVHHTCREKPVNNQGVSVIRGIVYLDLARKIPPKSDLNIMDELDNFAWEVLDILYEQYPDLNNTVDEWQWIDKGLWRQSPAGNDEIPDEKLMNYICQITIACDYYSNNRIYE